MIWHWLKALWLLVIDHYASVLLYVYYFFLAFSTFAIQMFGLCEFLFYFIILFIYLYLFYFILFKSK